jgi:hypothetical protein
LVQAETKTPARAPALQNENPRDRAEHALRQANRAAKSGDLAKAERWSKTAERLAQAAERLAALPPPVDERQDEEQRRAELRRRIFNLVKDSHELQTWEAERDHYQAALAYAIANGKEPPPLLRPNPLAANITEETFGIGDDS